MSFYYAAHSLLLNKLKQFNLEAAAQFTSCGVLQLVEKPFAESEFYSNLTPLEASEIAGVSLSSSALNFSRAGWLNPKQLCSNLVNHPLIKLELGRDIINIKDSEAQQPDDPSSNLNISHADASETEIRSTHKLDFIQGKSEYAEHIVLTTGAANNLLPDSEHLPITAARGQISRFALCEKSELPNSVVSGKHYVIPDGNSLLVGASFHRGKTDTHISKIDHAANLAGLRQLLPKST